MNRIKPSDILFFSFCRLFNIDADRCPVSARIGDTQEGFVLPVNENALHVPDVYGTLPKLMAERIELQPDILRHPFFIAV